MRELVRKPCVIDYGTLDGVLSHGKIFPCDLDGCVEVKGNLLFIETKFHDDDLSEGQRLMLEALAKIPGAKVVVVVIDKKTTSTGAFQFIPLKMRIIPKDNIHTDYIDCTMVQWNEFYTAWYKNAFTRPFIRR